MVKRYALVKDFPYKKSLAHSASACHITHSALGLLYSRSSSSISFFLPTMSCIIQSFMVAKFETNITLNLSFSVFFVQNESKKRCFG